MDNNNTNALWERWNKPIDESNIMWLLNYLDVKKKSVEKKAAEKDQTDRVQSSINLDNARMNVSSKDIDDQMYVASRWDELAAMIVDYGKDHWRTISGSTADVINTYLEWIKDNPAYWDRSKEFYDYTHGTEDRYSFAERMWWLAEPTDAEKTVDWLKNVWNNWKWSFKTAWKWLRDLVYSFDTANWDTEDVKANAITEYAYAKYGKDITDDEWRKVEWDIEHNPEVLDSYIADQRPISALVETVWWWIAALANTTWRWAILNGVIAAGIETPYLRDVIWLAWEWLDAIWGLWIDFVSLVPWIWDEIKEMSPETRSMANQFLWGYLFWKAIMKEWEWGNIEARPWVKNVFKNITPKWLRKQIDKVNKDPQLKTLEKEQNLQNGKEQLANKILEPEQTKFTPQISNTLDRLEWLEKITTFEELWDAVDGLMERVVRTEDELLSQDTRTTGPANDTQVYKGATFHPVREWINILRQIYADDRVILAQIDQLEWLYQQWKVTAKVKNDMARAITKGYESYTKNNELKASEIAWKVEEIRQSLKRDARWWLEDYVPWFKNALEYLDKVYSEAITTKTHINTMKNKLQKAEAKQKISTPARNAAKAWNTTAEAFLSRWRSLTTKRKNKLNSPYNPISLQNDLNLALRLFSSKKAKLWGTNNEELIEAYLSKLAADENVSKTTAADLNDLAGEFQNGPLEWEVINPKEPIHSNRNIYDSNKYLEDIVQYAEATRALLEDPNYNWQEPINYSTPTRVTPEGYAARYWQTLEWWKEVLKEIWIDEKEIPEIEKVLRTVTQEPLIKDVPNGKRTDFLWRDTWTSKSKK